MSKSGAQKGHEAFLRFKSWVDERWEFNDWNNYIRANRSELKRKEIYTECMFDRGAFKRAPGLGNPAIVKLLDETESTLLEKGILKEKQENIAGSMKSSAQEKSEQTTKMMRDKQLMKSQEENSILKARVQELEGTLRKYDLIDKHMIESGRLIRG